MESFFLSFLGERNGVSSQNRICWLTLILPRCSQGPPSECSVDQAESSSAKMPDLHNIDHKFNEESCVVGKPETEANGDALNSSIPITNAHEPPVQGHTVPDKMGSDELVDVCSCRWHFCLLFFFFALISVVSEGTFCSYFYLKFLSLVLLIRFTLDLETPVKIMGSICPF